MDAATMHPAGSAILPAIVGSGGMVPSAIATEALSDASMERCPHD